MDHISEFFKLKTQGKSKTEKERNEDGTTYSKHLRNFRPSYVPHGQQVHATWEKKDCDVCFFSAGTESVFLKPILLSRHPSRSMRTPAKGAFTSISHCRLSSCSRSVHVSAATRASNLRQAFHTCASYLLHSCARLSSILWQESHRCLPTYVR